MSKIFSSDSIPFAIAFLVLGLPVLSTLYVVGRGLFVWREIHERGRRQEEIVRTGERVPAVVRSVAQTGRQINRDPEVIVDLEVQPADQPPYSAIVRFTLLQIHIPRVQAGAMVTVAVSRKDPADVAICF